VDDRVGVEASAHEHAAQSHEGYVRQRLRADVSELARRVDFGRQHVAVFAAVQRRQVDPLRVVHCEGWVGVVAVQADDRVAAGDTVASGFRADFAGEKIYRRCARHSRGFRSVAGGHAWGDEAGRTRGDCGCREGHEAVAAVGRVGACAARRVAVSAAAGVR